MDHMVFEISWEGAGSPTLVQLVDNSSVVSLARMTVAPGKVQVTYDIATAPMHHLEWTFAFVGQALSHLQASITENADPTEWKLDSKDSAQNAWNSEGWV